MWHQFAISSRLLRGIPLLSSLNCLVSMLRIITVLLVVLLSLPHGQAQCTYSAITDITDNDTTTLQIEISNALLDDLSNAAQCVERVEIDFEHQFVGDISVELISPAGQSVRLLGPAVPSSPSTALINWDIDFLQCAATPTPDGGFPTTWNNVAGWASFTNYTGSYYPRAGCLEDFDTGPVNGLWTLVLNDVSQFGTGEIRSFTIHFCDDTSIDCAVCELADVSVAADTAVFCVDDTGPIPGTDLVFPGGTPSNTSDYTYSFGVFDASGLVAYEDDPQFEDIAIGTYQLCPVGYRNDLAADLPALGAVSSPDEWSSVIEALDACLFAKAECYTVEIVSLPDTLSATLSACLGESIVFGGQSYTDTATVFDVRIGPFCDTIVAVALEFIEPIPGILPDAPLLTCTDQEIWLTIAGDVPRQVTWSTTDGVILSTNGDSVLVNAAGTYVVSATDRGCSATNSILVEDDIDRPDITVNLDTFDCVTDTVLITLNNTEDLDIQWQRPIGPLNVADTLVAVDPGRYSVTATAANGCFTVETFDLVVDTSLQVPDVQVFAITCLVPLRTVRVNRADPSYSYQWTGPGGYNDDVLSADSIGVGGQYDLFFEAPNGCTGDTSIQVVDATSEPSIDLILPTIDCSAGPFTAIVAASEPLVNISWLDVDQATVYAGDTVEVSDGGAYLINYATTDGCLFDTTFVVPYDTVRPFLLASGGLIDCTVDSIQLGVTGDTTGLDLAWSGPGGFSSTDAEPYVTESGMYSLSYAAANNCSSVASVEVTKSIDKPDVSFDILPISCLRDSAFVGVSDKFFSYSWSDNLLPTTADSLIWDQPGSISVTITNNTTGCESRESVVLIDRRNGPRVDISIDDFSCATDSLQVMTDFVDSVTTFSWQGVAPRYQDSIEPYLFGLDTAFLTTTDVEGCVGLDTLRPGGVRVGPSILITDTIITCSRPRVTLMPESDRPLDSVIWRGPALFSPAFSITVGTAGVYRLEAYTVDGCVSMVEQTVSTDTAAPTIIIPVPDSLECLDTAVDLSADSDRGLSYEWFDGSTSLATAQSVEVTQPGTYRVMVQDSNGCTGASSVDVISLIDFPMVDFVIDAIDCDSDTTTIAATSQGIGNTYNWLSPGRLLSDSVLVGDVTGDYTLQVTNALGCIDTFVATALIDTVSPDATLRFSDTLSCNSPTVVLSGVEPTATYTWLDIRGVDSTASQLRVGASDTYTAVVVGTNGCVDTGTVFVPIDTSLLTLTFDDDTLSCFEGKVGLEVFGSRPIASVSWAGPLAYANTGDSITVFSPGTYTVSAVGDNGCETIDSVSVFLDQSTIESMIEDTFLPCDSSGTALQATSNDSIFQIRWSGPNGFFSEEASPTVFTPGNYVAAVAGESGCSTMDTFNLAFDQDIPIFDITVDSFTCIDPMVTIRAIDVQDDFAQVWLDNGGGQIGTTPTVTVADTGMYRLIVTGINRCKDTLDILPVDDRVFPQILLAQEDSLVCDQANTDLTALVSDSIGSTTYTSTWVDGSGAVIAESTVTNITADGIYLFEAVNDRNGCKTVDTIVVQEVTEPRLSYAISPSQPTCAGFFDGAITIDSVEGGFAPYLYSLDGNNYHELNNYRFLEGGTYTVYTTDRYGCEDSVQVDLRLAQNPTIVLPADTTIRLGDTLIIEGDTTLGNTAQYELSWMSAGVDISCDTCIRQELMPLENSWLSVTLIDDLGCETSDEMLINVVRLDDIELPNIFRINGDPANRVFYFPDVTGVDQVASFKIYDRLGGLMHERYNFEPGDISMGWDGTLRGEAALSAVYAYYFRVIYVDGREELIVGDVTLLR